MALTRDFKKTVAARVRRNPKFANLIVDHLTGHGVIGASLLYESPFTDVTPRGPDGLFTSPQMDALLAVLDQGRAAAVAA
jgi:type I restriction enzyme R subunit